MRRYRAALTAATALTLLLVTTVVVAGPAQAGGPTSVLMVVPGTGQTASLYTGDPDYEALASTVGAFSASGAATGKVDGTGEHAVGTGVTLTWLIHDVTVWRVDRVYLDAKGGPWISTQVDHTGTGIWDKPETWHTAVDGTVLADLLDRHGVDGVTGTDAAADETSPVQPDAAVVPDAPAATDTTGNGSTGSSEQAAESSGSRAGMLGWGLGGLALGVALTLAAMRLGQRSRTDNDRTDSDQPDHDQPLKAAEVSAVPAPWSPAEELQRR